MTAGPPPDLFTNVHKGIRKALFDLVVALGRAEPSPAASRAERALAREVTAFMRQHGSNEDAVIVPLLGTRAPEVFHRLERAHVEVAAEIHAFEQRIDHAPTPELYFAACHLAAFYLEHMNLEEVELERTIRAALTPEEAAAVGPQSVARTPPAELPSMLGFMLAAMPHGEANALLSRLPPGLAAELRPRVA